MKYLAIPAFVIMVVWGIYLSATKQAPLVEPPPPPIKVLTPAEDLAAAKAILKSKKSPNAADITTIQKHLKSIAPTLPEYKEVPALLKQTEAHERRNFREAAERITREGVPGRQKFVEELERVYLKKGFDVHLSASGPSKTVFTFKYVLVSRPLVYQLSNSNDFMTSLEKQGFQKAIFTDGYNNDMDSGRPLIRQVIYGNYHALASIRIHRRHR